jgi:hypothetical protein
MWEGGAGTDTDTSELAHRLISRVDARRFFLYDILVAYSYS